MNDLATPELLDACAAEPIRVPGSIQPHGALLVMDGVSFRLLQASANLESVTGFAFDAAAGQTLDDLPFADSGLKREIGAWLETEEPAFLRTLDLGGHAMELLGHRTPQGIVLEFEPSMASEREAPGALYSRLQRFFESLEAVSEIAELGQRAAVHLRELTGFDRVLIYRFGKDWNGTVVAEDGNGVLPSYLDLRFPASDIPAQARELYRLNRLRLIPDATYTPVPITPSMSPVNGRPLDLSFATLRSVSPVHLEYMRNMDTAASFSISITVEDALWGLISCHNRQPKRTSAHVRATCDLMGQVLSWQIGAKTRIAQSAERIELKKAESELLARLTREEDLASGLANHGDAWLRLTGATGAAIVTGETIRSVGNVPPDEQLIDLTAWLETQSFDGIFSTDALSDHWPPAAAITDIASGLLAASISQLHPSYILWFRPEVVRTVRWGGDPRKPADGERISPRKSFDSWKQLVERNAVPWRPAEIESARDFRNAIVNFVLRRAEEYAELSEELQRSNKELEAFSYSVSHDLRAPFRHIAGYAELLRERATALDEKSRHYLASIVDAALSAGRLVDDLLRFSQLGRISLGKTRVDMAKLVDEVKRSIEADLGDQPVEWRIGRLVPAWGDPSMLRQALFNLISNAVKYSRDRTPAVITVDCHETAEEVSYSVRDNGVGFDMAYVGKLFGVFQRLHRVEEFEGTGIGLALTRRIIDRHGGRITAEGALGHGAVFTFVLPKRDSDERDKD